jgi:hypothetical protein
VLRVILGKNYKYGEKQAAIMTLNVFSKSLYHVSSQNGNVKRLTIPEEQ